MGPISENGLGQVNVKPTSAKTPAPKRTVLPAPPKPPKRISQTPAQAANAAVSKLLAPQYSQAASQSAHDQAVIKGFTQAIIQQLAGLPGQTQGAYDSAISAQSQMAGAAADSLRNANPYGQDQQILNAIGAPAAQSQQIGSNLANVFNGGAAVGQYVNGVSPMAALQAQKLAAMDYQRALPGIEGLRGSQALQNELFNAAQNRLKIAAQAPGLEQNWLDAYTKNKNAQAQLAIEQRATHTFDPTKSRALGYQVDAQGRPIRLNGQYQPLPGYKVNGQGHVVKVTSSSVSKSTLPKISVGVSNSAGRGIALDASGKPVLVNGKTIPWKSGSKVTAKGQVVKVSSTKTAGAKTASTSQVNSFLKSLPLYKSVRTSDGAGGSTTTKQPSGHTMSYMAAYRRLKTMGLNDQTARESLNGIYKRGEDGRAWFTNVEQAVLRKAARARGGSYVGLKGAQAADIVKVNLDPVSHHAFLSPIQYQILKAAGQLPPGSFQNTPLGPRWYVAQ